MNLTFDELNEVKSFDVIFVGHLASVAAHLFASMTKNQYTSLVLRKHLIVAEQQKSIVQTSLLPLCPDEIKITKKIKYMSVHTKQLKVMSIKPVSKQIEVQGGKIYDYKYLVYSGNNEEWMDYSTIKTLPEALSNQYSLVYSNIKKRDLSVAWRQLSSGNVVFYVPKGRHSGYDNFNFLSVFEKFMKHSKSNENHVKPLSSKIILQGTEFFPFCKEADNLIKKEIHQRGIEVSYNSQLTKIDYLRRTLTINDKNQVPYNLLYCVVPQNAPSILKAAQIDPYLNNPRTLQNRKYKNIFIYGADVYPTTHTFESVQYQTHYIVKNLEHLLSRTGEISVYNGLTKIPIYLGTKEVVEVVHYYSKKEQCNLEQFEPVVSQKCSWLAMVVGRLTKWYIAESYYNYNSYGAPYYIFAPALSSVKLIQEQKPIDISEPIVTRNSKQMQNEGKGMKRMNQTADITKNSGKMVKC